MYCSQDLDDVPSAIAISQPRQQANDLRFVENPFLFSGKHKPVSLGRHERGWGWGWKVSVKDEEKQFLLLKYGNGKHFTRNTGRQASDPKRLPKRKMAAIYWVTVAVTFSDSLNLNCYHYIRYCKLLAASVHGAKYSA
ncbi:hypothetical protein CDAR_556721 [Caerostris darwini]|uniref:Uncharacterized protein n=1 Tax=Caerostris darwini TaxID=1538125 RepID=A0AAV4WM91_9ARAC|nr:hypothetical protein CDAR_556721 [Caerostris darwini]